jgi:hypothetical protein
LLCRGDTELCRTGMDSLTRAQKRAAVRGEEQGDASYSYGASYGYGASGDPIRFACSTIHA